MNYKLIEAKRKELNLSQTAVAARVSKISGETFSQQAYRKIEKGQSKNSKFLAHVCQALGLTLSEVNPSLDAVLDSTKDALVKKMNELPLQQRLAIVQEVLKGMESK